MQLENRRTLPSVVAALSGKKLNLHCWVYKFETGQVFGFDNGAGQFLPIEQSSGEPLPVTSLMHPQVVKDLWKYGKGEVAIYAATVITIVSTDLLTGVLTGIGLSMARLFFRFSRLTVDVEGGGGAVTLKPRGAATFVRLPVLAGVLEQVSSGSVVWVDLRALTCIDHACVELLMNWSKRHEATGGRVQIDWALLHRTAADVTADASAQAPPAAE